MSPGRFRSSAVAFAVVALLGCGPKRLDVYPERSVLDMTTVQSSGGLWVAIEPLLDEETVRRHFGKDLLGDDVLAVFVAARNDARDRSYVIRPEQVALLEEGATPPPSLVSFAPAVITGGIANAALAASMGLGIAAPAATAAGTISTAAAASGVLFVAAVPVMIAADKMADDAHAMKHRLVTAQLRSTTLSPGESTQGFVLLALPPELRGRQSELAVGYLDLDAGEGGVFRFPVAIPEEG